jgi:hypothetical protein
MTRDKAAADRAAEHAARRDKYVRQIVAGAPPFTEEQKVWLAMVLRPGVLALQEKQRKERRP